MKVMLCFFNEHFNVFFYPPKTQERWNKVSEDKKRIIDPETDSLGTMRLTKYMVNNLEIYTFGLLLDTVSVRPGHKGEWSSNEYSVMNVFGVDLVPIGMGGVAASIKREDMFKFVNKDKFYFRDLWLQSDIVMAEPLEWYDQNGNKVEEEVFD